MIPGRWCSPLSVMGGGHGSAGNAPCLKLLHPLHARRAVLCGTRGSGRWDVILTPCLRFLKALSEQPRVLTAAALHSDVSRQLRGRWPAASKKLTPAPGKELRGPACFQQTLCRGAEGGGQGVRAQPRQLLQTPSQPRWSCRSHCQATVSRLSQGCVMWRKETPAQQLQRQP